MSKTIAVAGKGGVGKTSISSRLIHELSRKGLVLAIDADPSTNLHQALGRCAQMLRQGQDQLIWKRKAARGNPRGNRLFIGRMHSAFKAQQHAHDILS